MIELHLRLPRADFELQVALQLPAHGVTALHGPSGCGKTSVLRAVAGLERAVGRVRLGAVPAAAAAPDDPGWPAEVWQDDEAGQFLPPHRRALGYVIQESALFPHLSVAQNIDFGRRRSTVTAGRRVALEPLIELLGIGALMDRRPAALSGGERQRVAIARALATSPRLLLMDEPLAALDVARKAEVLPYLERLHAELALPVLYVSHAIDEVARLADHVVLLDKGRVRAQGRVAEVMARLDLPTARDQGAGVVHPAVVIERDQPWLLARLQLGPPDLEVTVWARDPGLALGARTRVQLLARDVSVSLGPQAGSSIGNQLQGVVDDLADDEHPGLVLVRVRVGPSPGEALARGLPVLARLTRRSAHALGLAPGKPVVVQVKTVALMD